MYQNGSHLSFDPDSDLRTMFWIKFTYSFSTQILFLCKAQYLALATDCKILDARDYPMKNWKTVKTKLTKMHLALTNISGAFRSGSTTLVSGQSLISILYIIKFGMYLFVPNLCICYSYLCRLWPATLGQRSWSLSAGTCSTSAAGGSAWSSFIG